MRFLHLADLHLGKMLHGVSLLENGDQPAWVRAFLTEAEALRPDAVCIAGDVYDRSAPSGEAVTLLKSSLHSEPGSPQAWPSGSPLVFPQTEQVCGSSHVAGSQRCL